MKSAAPLFAAGGVIAAIVIGVFVFGDQLGLGSKKPAPEVVTEQPAKPSALLGDAKKSQQEDAKTSSDEKPAADVSAKKDGMAAETKDGVAAETKDGVAAADTVSEKAEQDADGKTGMSDSAAKTQDPSSAADKPEEGAASKKAGEVVEAAIVPSFDVVRVEPDGNTLVAGRASPNHIVTLMNGDKVLGTTTADAQGEWVILLDQPLGNGVTDLSLAARADASAVPVLSANSVTVARPEGGEGELLVVENVPGAASRILSKVAKENVSETKGDDASPDSSDAAPAASAVQQGARTPAVEDGKIAEIAYQLAIEAVEMEGDTLFVAGEARPAGSAVRLYVDNKAISDSQSGDTGRFLFDGALALEGGNHQIRVDLIGSDGAAVAKRVEVSFPRTVEKDTDGGMSADGKAAADGASAMAEGKKVIIRRGDNLWEIARRVYGAGIRYTTIYDSNSDQIRNPHWIYPGQVFELPAGEQDWQIDFDAVDHPDGGAREGSN